MRTTPPLDELALAIRFLEGWKRRQSFACNFGCQSRPRCYILMALGTHRRMSKDLSNGNDLVKNSSLYKEFQAELDEILRHKWLESEKAGRDIGFEQALTDWIMKHRSKWRKARQAAVAH